MSPQNDTKENNDHTTPSRLPKKEQVEGKVASARRHLLHSPNDYYLLENLGQICILKGEYFSAVKFFKKSIMLTGESDAISWLSLGKSIFLLGNYTGAQRIFSTFLRLNPNSEEARVGLCLCLIKGRDWVGIKPTLLEMLKTPLLSHKSLLEIAAALRSEKAFRYSLRFYQRIVDKYQSPDPLVQRGIGICYAELGDFKSAERYLLLAVILDPGDCKNSKLFVERMKPENSIKWYHIAWYQFLIDSLNPKAAYRLILGFFDGKFSKVLNISPLLEDYLAREENQNRKLEIQIIESIRAGTKSDVIEKMNKIISNEDVEASIWNNLILELGKTMGDVLDLFDLKILRVAGSEKVLWFNIGLYHCNRDRFEKSLFFLRIALILDPAYVKPLNQASIAEGNSFRFDLAEKFAKKAVTIHPPYSVAWMNRGIFARSNGKIFDGIQYLRQAIASSGGFYPDATYNLALQLLAIGKIEEGYRSYRQRWFTQSLKPHKRNFLEKIWPGPGVASDCRLFTYMEQGMGDEVMYSQILPMIYEDCSSLTVECDERLIKTFARTFPDIAFFPRVAGSDDQKRAGDFDFQAPVAQAVEFYSEKLRCDMAMLSGGPDLRGVRIPPRLCVDPKRLSYWRSYLTQNLGEKLIVGVAWRSGLRTHLRNQQYLDPQSLIKTIPPGAGVINLQYDYSEEEVELFESIAHDKGFKFLPPAGINLKDALDDIFALIQALDVVVSPLISTPWMAAAVGTPSLVFRCNENGHIWQQFGQTYVPWGPNIRLFFRSPLQSWDRSISRIRANLVTRSENKKDLIESKCS